MKSLKIGHYTDAENKTGLTVFLFEKSAVGAYLICGASPATRELHILETDSNVDAIHGLVLTGGSAYGLGTVDGVMRYLTEKQMGKAMPHGVVPIVPAAAIYDLAVGTAHIPTAEDAYQACLKAKEQNFQTGCIGAGTGASVGKLVPHSQKMSGGFGVATRELATGVTVTVFAVVNAVGDIRNEQNQIIAGAKNTNHEFVNCENYLLSGNPESYSTSDNTTLIAIFTNASFSKTELKRIAKIAVSGMSRAISPVFTRYDGDVIFSFSLGEHKASEVSIGTLAAELVRQAIVSAVQDQNK